MKIVFFNNLHPLHLASCSPPIWDIERCSNINPLMDANTIQLVTGGKWPDDEFCHAVRTDLKVADDSAYHMTVEVNLVSGKRCVGPDSTTCGHFGFAFNYWDNNNYDFVYKR